MNITSKDLGQRQLELTIEVAVADLEPQLKKAADRLSQKSKIDGFRAGKVPYEMVRSRLGDMAIYQEALEDVLQATFWQAISEQKLVTIGQPKIEVQKMAPNNPLVYTAIVALMPEVKLGSWQTLRFEPTETKITAEEVEKVINDLASMQATELIVLRPAQMRDKAEVDFEVLIDKVVIEGGSGKKYPLILGSNSMIPGFEEQIIGMKAGENKTFNLRFPKEYFQSNLADKEAEFKVSLNNVYQRTLPQIDDAWAEKMSGKKLPELKQNIEENIFTEKNERAELDLEQKILERIIADSTWSELPEILLTSEAERMLHELKHGIEAKHMKWDEYLQNLKRSEDDILKDFKPQAERRIKGALILQQIAKEEKIIVTPEEIEAEIKRQEPQYAGNANALQELHSPRYRNYVGTILFNRKTIGKIRETVIKAK